MASNKITKKDLNEMAVRSMAEQCCFSFERMQAVGFCYGMTKCFRKIHGDNNEEMAAALKNNLDFINTEPHMAAILQGLIVSMEEAGQDRTMIHSLKTGLFGPLAGLGDAIWWYTAMPIIASICCSLATQNNVLGPIFYILFWALTAIFSRIWFVRLGYNAGVNSIKFIGDNAAYISKAAGILGAAGALAACGGSGDSTADTASTAESTASSTEATAESTGSGDEAVTLNWALWDKDSTAYWQALADGYMESHPNVTIEMTDLGSTDYMTQLATQLAGGNGELDVLSIKDIPGYSNLINLGMLEPLSGKLTTDESKFNGVLEQLTAEDGNYYAVPFRSDFWVVYYNKDIFDQAGVEYPTNDMTMADFDAKIREVYEKTGIYGNIYHTWRSTTTLFGILDGKNTIIDGKYDFMKPTYDMVIAQQKDGICMDYGYLKTSSLHYSAAFENQQCAMVNMGSWFISTLEAYMKDAETKFNWGIVKYPHPAGAEAGSTLGTVTSLAINADSPKAEAAADFINWCVSEEGAQAIAKTGTFPACGSAATAEIIKSTEGFPEDSNSVDALTTSNVYLEMPYTQYASDIETILNAEHDAIMTMSETVDEGIQNMNDQVPAVLG